MLAACSQTSQSDPNSHVQLGPRPFYLLAAMPEGGLKDKLSACQNGPFYPSRFSIGHRGAPLQFPEHTQQSYLAAAKMGAGALECDVTFTKDHQLVCRHSQCDLHTTTNILATSLASKCSVPFTPADPNQGTPASAKCCTSDISLAEFLTLDGKMDAANPHAKTVAEYLGGTPPWRTELYASHGTLMTHAQSIALFKSLGRHFTPELKAPEVSEDKSHLSQQQFAKALIDEYRSAGIDPAEVWPQSFNLKDILYWQKIAPDFAKQAIYLEDRDEPQHNSLERQVEALTLLHHPEQLTPTMAELAGLGVKIIAPPLWALVTVENQQLVPSAYAKAARAAGLDIIAWSLERSGPLRQGGGWYYQSINGQLEGQNQLRTEGDVLTLLDVLAKDIGVIGVFSDWPATTSFYANCMQLSIVK
ncbi:glycerophosphodiester phosphodiesterase family protein [Pseudoalteromonas fenneropenaei]|uniref:glycerophosphodiester phosphodiesterase n=1 Tax=Pseudoalteromonas fenneropenaei TaxID=1737459 RepID=A0ABV7CK96_9GAMM